MAWRAFCGVELSGSKFCGFVTIWQAVSVAGEASSARCPPQSRGTVGPLERSSLNIACSDVQPGATALMGVGSHEPWNHADHHSYHCAAWRPQWAPAPMVAALGSCCSSRARAYLSGLSPTDRNLVSAPNVGVHRIVMQASRLVIPHSAKLSYGHCGPHPPWKQEERVPPLVLLQGPLRFTVAGFCLLASGTGLRRHR